MPCTPTSKKLCGEASCAVCFPRSIASFADDMLARNIWFSADNETPAALAFRGSSKVYKWMCTKASCLHAFEATPSHIFSCGTTTRTGCPYCANQKLCTADSCDICMEKSVAHHAAELLDRKIVYSPGNAVSARQVFKYSGKARLWICLTPGCGHTFSAVPSSVLSDTQPSSCTYCSDHGLCGDASCETCKAKTIAYITEDLLARNIRFSASNKVPPHKVRLHSEYFADWDCLVCDHTFNAVVRSVIAGTGCSFCGNCRLCDDDKCDTCLEKSVAYYAEDLEDRGVRFSTKNDRPARQVFRGASYLHTWECISCGNVFDAAPAHMTGMSSGCPLCRSSCALALHTLLVSIFGEAAVVREAKFPWCKNVKMLPFDWSIGKNGKTILIELDGVQHFIEVEIWRSKPEDAVARDTYKAFRALQDGTEIAGIIRIAQPDIYKKWKPWKSELLSAIDAVLSGSTRTAYISSDPALYNSHKDCLATAMTSGVSPEYRRSIPPK